MRKIILLIVGWLLVAVGLVLTPAPIPIPLIGIVPLLVGCAILSANSKNFRRMLQRLRQRFAFLSRRLEGVRYARDGLKGERHELGRFTKEAGDGLRHDALLLSPCAPLNQHLQVELLGRQAFKGVLADGPEAPLVHVFE